MAKYSYEFKLKIIQDYLNGEGGYKYICDKHSIPDTKTLRQWVSAYNTFGKDGLMRSRKSQTYTFDFKIHVVELYLTTEVSYQELALQVGINNSSMLCKWINDYRIAGPDALKPKMKGRPPKMKKSKETKKVQNSANDADDPEDKYLKRLEEENLKLRIENAYLKELRGLRLEEKPQNKKRE
jgi:transposase